MNPCTGHFCRLIGQVGRVFANCPGDLGSIPGRVTPKTLKMVLDTTLLNTQLYKVRMKRSNPGKRVAPSSTPRCSSYWKGNLLVANLLTGHYSVIDLTIHVDYTSKVYQDTIRRGSFPSYTGSLRPKWR